jgi:hypothetical protein
MKDREKMKQKKKIHSHKKKVFSHIEKEDDS